MDKIYRLDLLTLIESLQQQSATLTAELPAGLVPGVFEACKGFVRIRHGEIVKSAIVGKSGPQVSGPDALRYLRTVDRWLVKIEQEQPEDLPPAPPVAPSIPLSPSQPFSPYPPQTAFPAQTQITPPQGAFSAPQSSFPISQVGFTPPLGVFSQSPETTPQPSFAPPPLRPPVIIPRQSLPLPDRLLERLSHRERMIFRLVYTMVNGHRSIDQIKEQLHISSETIDHVLEELRRLNIIDW